MNKFIVKPNRTVEEIIELNKKHTQNLIHEIRSNKLKKEPWLNDQFWLDRGYQYFEGRLRSPMYVQSKLMQQQIVTSN